jgi:hypothetical protein
MTDESVVIFSQLEQLQREGYVIWRGHVTDTMVQQLRKRMMRLMTSLQKNYDVIEDNFDIDNDKWNLVRFPRIGLGKHNLHFDPFESIHHQYLNNFCEQCYLPTFLSQYTKTPMKLRETGISVTRPYMNGRHGDGMEWHSDGSKGKIT